MSANQTFQSFWYGDTLSPYEKMCLRSFLDHGHSFHLYTYSSQLEVPSGVELKCASELLDSSQYFTYGKGRGAGSHAAFSDLFRYKLLFERGGWWVDTDVVCLSKELPRYDEFFAYEKDDIVNGAVLFFPRADPLMLNCLDEALRIQDRASWGEIGPLLITRIAKQRGRLIAAQSKTICYAIHHSEALDLLRPMHSESHSQRIRQSLFLHLWNEIFRRAHVSKVMLPPRGSLLRKLADQHPVEGWRGEYDIDALEEFLYLETEVRRLRKELEAMQKKRQRNEPIKTVDVSTQKVKPTGNLQVPEKILASLWRLLKVAR